MIFMSLKVKVIQTLQNKSELQKKILKNWANIQNYNFSPFFVKQKYQKDHLKILHCLRRFLVVEKIRKNPPSQVIQFFWHVKYYK